MIRRYRWERYYASLFGHLLAIDWSQPHRRNVTMYEWQFRIYFRFVHLAHVFLLYFVIGLLAIELHILFFSYLVLPRFGLLQFLIYDFSPRTLVNIRLIIASWKRKREFIRRIQGFTIELKSRKGLDLVTKKLGRSLLTRLWVSVTFLLLSLCRTDSLLGHVWNVPTHSTQVSLVWSLDTSR